MFKILRLSILVFILAFTSCVSLQPREAAPPAEPTLYDTIIFDIASIGSGTPSEGALTFLRDKINHYRIARTVVFRQRQDISSPFVVWDLGQVVQFEQDYRQLHDRNSKDRLLVVFVSYLPGIYINGDVTGIAGIQYGDTSFAIFRHITEDSWEGVVLLHELGHMLTIAKAGNRSAEPVNPERPNHCNNSDCVMFWRAGVRRTEFDSECLRELQQLIRGDKPKRKSRLYCSPACSTGSLP